MNFGQALEALKLGKKVSRDGWNGKGMFLFLVPSIKFSADRLPHLGFFPDGTEMNFSAHVYMKNAQGDVVPWMCYQTDMLAEDWGIVE